MEQKSVDKYMDRDIRTHAIIGAAMEVHIVKAISM